VGHRIKGGVEGEPPFGEEVESQCGFTGDDFPPRIHSLSASIAEEMRYRDDAHTEEGQNDLFVHTPTSTSDLTDRVKHFELNEAYNGCTTIGQENCVDLGQLIRQRRQEKGWTQQQLADRVGVTKGAISEIERGGNRGYMGSTLQGLSKALDIPVDVLSGHRLHSEVSGAYGRSGQKNSSHRIRIVGTAHLTESGEWLELEPLVDPRAALDFPSDDPKAYAICIKGDALHPRIKSGEYIVLEPNRVPEPGDEVRVILTDGRSVVRELGWMKEEQIALNGLSERQHRITLDRDEVKAIHFVAAIVKESRYRLG
jgi:transcriptional regulator with XRE-family HTH domain